MNRTPDELKRMAEDVVKLHRPDVPPACAKRALILIEQPDSITDGVWFFCRGLGGGFGAKYGVSLHEKEVENRLAAKAGAGKLVHQHGRWWWAKDK